MTYLNTSCFTISLLPTVGAKIYKLWKSGHFSEAKSLSDVIDRYDSYHEATSKQQREGHNKDVEGLLEREQNCRTPLLAGSPSSSSSSTARIIEQEESGVIVNHQKLGFKETVNIAFEFCLLWVSYAPCYCHEHYQLEIEP